jgi:hypothetical protein
LALREEIASAIEHEKWLVERTNAAQVPSRRRNQMMGGLLFQVQENATAVRVLLTGEHRLYGAAAALVRPLFEMYVRALWVRSIASDEEFELVSTDDNRWPLGMEKMAKAVDDQLGLNGWLSGIERRYWDAFCSYAHGGLRLIARRNSPEAIEDVATEEEAIEILRFAVLMSLLAGSVWCELAGDVEGATEASARARPYLGKVDDKPEPEPERVTS